MKATTIKLEGRLLEQLKKAKPPSKSVTAYVREVLESDIRRKRVAEAAVEYRAFVKNHPDEESWISDWGNADLATPPRTKKGRS